MGQLLSGLPNAIGDNEELARYLKSSSQYNSHGVKGSAFMPNPVDNSTSVFRQGAEPQDELWELGLKEAVGARTLYGAAIVSASDVVGAGLIVKADEPPTKHAVIFGWPIQSADKDLEKAKHKEIALRIASCAILILRSSLTT